MGDLRPHDMDVLQELAKGPRLFLSRQSAEEAALALRIPSLAKRDYVALEEADGGIVATLTDKGVEAVVRSTESQANE